MQILFVSDYVCPYCLVAKEALKQALAETGMEAEITWQPYELTPESRERVDTWHDEKRRANYQILVEPCARLGLDMKLPPHVIPRPYTRLAFEGWYYACGQGKADAYNDLVYQAYFILEQDIGDISVLAELAKEWTVLSCTKPSISAKNPRKCIDFILALRNGAKYEVVGSDVPTEFRDGDVTIASDHLPVFVDVRL